MATSRFPESRKGRNYGTISTDPNGDEAKPFLEASADNRDVPGYYRLAPWWSRLVFGWLGPLLSLGNETDRLGPEDVAKLPLLPDDVARYVSFVFDEQWEKERERAAARASAGGEEPLPSLTRSLWKAFGRDFMLAGVLKFFHDLLQFVGPHVLNGLINFLRNEDAPFGEGASLTAAVVLAQIVMSFCLRHYFFQCYRTGMRVRTAVVAAVYRKALNLSAFERQTRTVGEITNLMSIDAQRLQDSAIFLHAVWYSVIQIALALYFLWRQLGPSCLGGVAVIMVSMPLTAKVAQLMGRLQKNLMKARDERVDVNNEVLGSMKVIKLQAWELSFKDRIIELRKKELAQLLWYLLGRCCTFILWSSVPLLVALATFAAYVLSGNDLEVASALTALVLFDILRFPLFMLPNVINTIVEASVAVNRIRSFLLCDEYQPVRVGSLDGVGVEMRNATFVYESKRPKDPPLRGRKEDKAIAKQLSDTRWELELLQSQLADAEQKIQTMTKGMDSPESPEESSSLLSLRRVDLSFKNGEFIAVVGAVGSGKSTLINAILGEVRPLSGSVNAKGKVAYFSQNAFMTNDTVRANIVFGNPDGMDVSKYQMAIDACALKKDLEILPNGDMCEIGEKGITLSGGQKARIAMARGIYHDADIYLLDDPLAAVDAHVGKHLFEKCIVDELLLGKGGIWKSHDRNRKKRLIILVTNTLQYLKNPHIDRIVVLKNGTVEEVGSYHQLITKSATFQKLLDSFHETLGESKTKDEEVGDTEDETSEDNGDSAIPQPTLSFLKSLSQASRRASRRSSVPIRLKIPPPTRRERRAQSLKLALPANTPTSDRSSTLLTDELAERETGHVSRDVYLHWARGAGGICVAFLIILSYLAVEGINVLSQWWLTYWSEHGAMAGQLRFLAIYAIINFTAVGAMFCRMLLLMLCGIKAARVLFSEMLEAALGAPMSFFDTTPLGRIINRFSKDIYTIDEVLPNTFQMYFSTLASVIGVIVVISSVTPLFIVFLVPILIFYAKQQDFFTKTYRELKRLDSIARSPIYALFSESLDGVATIRAFSVQSYLSDRMVSLLDEQQNAYFLTCTANCWLGVRLELAGTLIIAFACGCAIVQHGTMAGNETFAGLAGLSISFALSVTQALNWSVRMASDLEANMVAVERVRQYCQLENEAPSQMKKDSYVDPNWPSKGVIEFKNSKLRYRPGLPLVLKGMSFVIPGHSKVGVVGRTGAGKSTIMVSLLRIVELDSGSILIDGVDIRSLGLKKLRSNVAVIPQDPTLFSGTVRTNLDPFHEYDDERLCKVLQRVGLMTAESTTSTSILQRQPSGSGAVKSLSDEVFEGGSNFSVGQRQLLVIARALLCESTIVIMDEATAAVDSDTDAKIQRLMRTEFKDATCITVAHRLNTIMDSDIILVMDDGRAAEFGPPAKLLKRGGPFKELVDTFEQEKGQR